jgi:hypothetical protein
MGARGRATALATFSWPAVAEQMEAVYQLVRDQRLVRA